MVRAASGDGIVETWMECAKEVWYESKWYIRRMKKQWWRNGIWVGSSVAFVAGSGDREVRYTFAIKQKKKRRKKTK